MKNHLLRLSHVSKTDSESLAYEIRSALEDHGIVQLVSGIAIDGCANLIGCNNLIQDNVLLGKRTCIEKIAGKRILTDSSIAHALPNSCSTTVSNADALDEIKLKVDSR